MWCVLWHISELQQPSTHCLTLTLSSPNSILYLPCCWKASGSSWTTSAGSTVQVKFSHPQSLPKYHYFIWSTNLTRSTSTPLSRSLIKILNNTGSKRHHHGIPLVTAIYISVYSVRFNHHFHKKVRGRKAGGSHLRGEKGINVSLLTWV